MLFNGSIAENIAYGGPPDCSLEDVFRAAREAQMHDHIVNRFPQVLTASPPPPLPPHPPAPLIHGHDLTYAPHPPSSHPLLTGV